MDIRQAIANFTQGNTNAAKGLVVAGLFAVISFVTLAASHAATFAGSAEAESGSQQNTLAGDPSGASGGASIKFGTLSSTAGAKFVTSVAANGRYLQDQTGAPILVKGDSPWSMFADMSPAQVELWAANRENHGFNAAIVSLIGSTGNGGPSNNGATYDGVQPFVGGNVTAWNEAYWSRMDNYLTILKNHGITAFLYPIDGWTTLPGATFYNKSAANTNTFGTMVASRYPSSSYPNIVWMVGGDYNGFDSTINSEFTSMLTGIRFTGDNRLFSIQLNTETVSTDVPSYEPLVNWNFAYSYSSVYATVLSGYNRPASSRDPRPVVLSESTYEGENANGGPATTNETLRRQQLWALTSGSAGDFTGSADWLFNTGWESRLDTTWITQMQKIRTFFSDSLNWQLLVPDTTNPFVTAGRGTKVGAGSNLDVLQNDYVTAAQTPDKSQAVVYVPTNTGNTNARTITLDTNRLPTSYTATWVDPTDATTSQPASINGSGQVTTPGLHGDGTRDWLLVLR